MFVLFKLKETLICEQDDQYRKTQQRNGIVVMKMTILIAESELFHFLW